MQVVGVKTLPRIAMREKGIAWTGAIAAAGFLSACTVGPDYRRPDAPVPAQYKETGWKVGEPSDAIDRGAWWSIYKDPVLDDLEKRIDISNQNLKTFEAAYYQDRALVDQSRASFLPTISADGTFTRSHSGGGTSSRTTSAGGVV